MAPRSRVLSKHLWRNEWMSLCLFIHSFKKYQLGSSLSGIAQAPGMLQTARLKRSLVPGMLSAGGGAHDRNKWWGSPAVDMTACGKREKSLWKGRKETTNQSCRSWGRVWQQKAHGGQESCCKGWRYLKAGPWAGKSGTIKWNTTVLNSLLLPQIH